MNRESVKGNISRVWVVFERWNYWWFTSTFLISKFRKMRHWMWTLRDISGLESQPPTPYLCDTGQVQWSVCTGLLTWKMKLYANFMAVFGVTNEGTLIQWYSHKYDAWNTVTASKWYLFFLQLSLYIPLAMWGRRTFQNLNSLGKFTVQGRHRAMEKQVRATARGQIGPGG